MTNHLRPTSVIPLLLAAVLCGCSLSNSPAPLSDRAGFRASSSSASLEPSSGPSAYTPTSDIAGPAAGISRRCTPQPNGVGSDCRALGVSSPP